MPGPRFGGRTDWPPLAPAGIDASRESEEGEDGDESSSRRAPRRRQNTGRRNVKPRGSGPREGGNEEWVLTRRTTRGKGTRSTTRDE